MLQEVKKNSAELVFVVLGAFLFIFGFAKSLLLSSVNIIFHSRLNTFSVAANKIAKIEARALEPVHQITTLSLQDNQLVSVASNDGSGMSF